MIEKRAVVDPSAIIAAIFKEKHGPWAEKYLRLNHGKLIMCNVNLFESLIVMRHRNPKMYMDAKRILLKESGITFMEPSMEVIMTAVDLKHRHPRLNFGDCFTAALAIVENCPIFAIDADFKKIGQPVIMP